MTLRRPLLWTLCVASTVAVMLQPSISTLSEGGPQEALAADRLIGRAVLPAATFAPGPTSGTLLGDQSINGQEVPFVNKQPVQGLSALLDNGDGTFLAMSDNGFGTLENSADFHLRVYTIGPKFVQLSKTGDINSGDIQIEAFIELHDPDKHISFAITNHFTEQRILTGADFDIESMQRARDGTLWFGDEFGPFLLHTDANGKVLEPPIPLPDFDNLGQEIRSPQNPFNEEASAVRIMNAVHAHAQTHGNHKAPVFSPWYVMLADGNPDTFVDNRAAPPEGSGLVPASSEIFSISSIQSAGYPIVTWTVDDKASMLELMQLRVNGIISDRPDLLRQAVEEFDANGDGTPGDFLDAAGLVDLSKFDAQGHRGGRNLRPENTLPAMEVALDFLMSTLESDLGITADGVPVLDHDPHVQAIKCRFAFDPTGTVYTEADEVLVKDLTVAALQHPMTGFICDKLLEDRPDQTNDLSLSPVSAAFATDHGIHPYVMPTLQQLFDFVNFYVEYYQSGPGSSHTDAKRRWENAQKVRFNLETKINPRAEFAARTIAPEPFAQKAASVIMANGLQERADIQSFDFRSLLVVQEQFPKIRTVYLFGDFPIFADPSIPGSDDGTNLQDEHGQNTPWLAGLFWPYRITTPDHPFRSQRSGGFEGMALSQDGNTLLPLLEKPLVGGEEQTLLMHEFDIASRSYTGTRYKYLLDPRGTAIGAFQLFGDRHGVAIERDDTQGDLNGFKVIFEVELQGAEQLVTKTLAVDLMKLSDPLQISAPGEPGDVGIGTKFAFPFTTIEDVVVLDRNIIGVINDNNFPFSVGRHVSTGQPDDTEFIIILLERTLGTSPPAP